MKACNRSSKRPVAEKMEKLLRFIPEPRGSNGQVEQTTNRQRMKNPLPTISPTRGFGLIYSWSSESFESSSLAFVIPPA